MNDVSGDVGVEAGRREHIQDDLVVGEKKEFSTCGEFVRKASEACDESIAFLLRSRLTRRGSAKMSQIRKRRENGSIQEAAQRTVQFRQSQLVLIRQPNALKTHP